MRETNQNPPKTIGFCSNCKAQDFLELRGKVWLCTVCLNDVSYRLKAGKSDFKKSGGQFS